MYCQWSSCSLASRVPMRIQWVTRSWKWSRSRIRTKSWSITSRNLNCSSWHSVHSNLPIQLLWMCWISPCFTRFCHQEQNIRNLRIHQCYWNPRIRRRITSRRKLTKQRVERYHLRHQQPEWRSRSITRLHQCYSLPTINRCWTRFQYRLRLTLNLYLIS